METRTRNGTRLIYDPAENVISLWFPDLGDAQVLKNAEDVTHHFADLEAFWRAHCGNRKVYWLLDYQYFRVDESLREVYTERLKPMLDTTALEAVRYGGEIWQRATARFYAIKTHSPLHLYATRAEALAALAKLKKAP